jgi:hypothetical protein
MIEISDQCNFLAKESLFGLKSITISNENRSFIFEQGFLLDINENILIKYFGKSIKVYTKNFVEII